jgi:uncharacterized protein YneF (UPF0154 family)
MTIQMLGAFLLIACVCLTVGAALGYYTAANDAQRERDDV